MMYRLEGNLSSRFTVPPHSKTSFLKRWPEKSGHLFFKTLPNDSTIGTLVAVADCFLKSYFPELGPIDHLFVGIRKESVHRL